MVTAGQGDRGKNIRLRIPRDRKCVLPDLQGNAVWMLPETILGGIFMKRRQFLSTAGVGML